MEKEITFSINNKEDGFFDMDARQVCMSAEHTFPSHMVIPQGKGYKYTCPSCGEVSICVSPIIF